MWVATREYPNKLIEQFGWDNKHHLMKDQDDVHNIASIDLWLTNKKKSKSFACRAQRCKNLRKRACEQCIYNKVNDSNVYSIIPAMVFNQNMKK